MRTLEQRIAEAASDLKMGKSNAWFAEQYGGVEALEKELFDLVAEWEGDIGEDEA